MVLCMSVRPFFLKHGRGLSDSLLDGGKGEILVRGANAPLKHSHFIDTEQGKSRDGISF